MTTLERRRRWAATARTWALKAAQRLRWDADRAEGELRWLAGYEANQTLAALLEASDLLVPALNDEDVPDALRLARDLADRLRDRDRAAKLGRVDGRTPEETEVFRRKAAELAAR